jgi:signal transduction histidine kinase
LHSVGSDGSLDDYYEADRDFRVQQAKVGCILVLVCMPLGLSLDWFVYGDRFPILPFLLWRAVCDVAVAPIYYLLHTDRGRRHIDLLGLLWPLLPAVSISWMIYATEGAASPYYAGLNLVLIVACYLMPYTLREALAVCGATLFTYLFACLGYRLHHNVTLPVGVLFNNVYFITITALICVTASYFNTGRRIEEFRLRSELDARNKELGESYEKLSQLDRLKSEFFANVSHELRTPLTLILSPLADLLRQPDLTAAVREPLTLARQNGLRLLKLINDLLELVRLEEGQAELKREHVDLSSFVPGLVDSVKYLARAKGLFLEASGGGGALVVEADPARLEKVVINLLTNAIKFTPAGGVIRASWGRDNGSAVLEVRDTGVGIPREHLPHIFERFRQADGSSTRKYQGAGIGLALARELVEEHGGKLVARSEVGTGTTFRVELPAPSNPAAPVPDAGGSAETDQLAQVYRDAERSVTLDTADVPAGPVGNGRHLVLVVEDEPDMRKFIVSVLSAEHRVLQAADGQAGLAMATEHRPDLALLDFMLPKLNGLELCEALRADGRTGRTKIVLLTARMDDEAKIGALTRGADDFLTKPFSSIELRARLANLLRSAELEESLRQRKVELEQALARLKETEVQLVQSEKMNALGKLSAGLLHEINNPLNFMITALQVARDEAEGNAALAETLADIGDGMNRIRLIVSDLRTFAYPTRPSEQSPFPVEEALTLATRLTAHELEGLTVDRTGVSANLVVGSKNQVVHVLMNLLVNSAQAIREAGGARAGVVRVSAAAVGSRLTLSVWDNGVGIKPADLPRVFEPFFTTKEVGEGMGLGLSICHTIVRNHGGTLSVRSQEGEWTEATFDLPLAHQEN